MTQQLNNNNSGGRSEHSLSPEVGLVWDAVPTAAAVPAGGWEGLLVFVVSSALGEVGKEGRVSQRGPPEVFSPVTWAQGVGRVEACACLWAVTHGVLATFLVAAQ